jgi:hypothetical protein
MLERAKRSTRAALDRADGAACSRPAAQASLIAGPDVSARSVRLHKLELNNGRLAGHGDDDAW